MSTGDTAYELMRRLFPLCRSLTGDGVRATFDVLAEHIPIERTEVASGTHRADQVLPLGFEPAQRGVPVGQLG